MAKHLTLTDVEIDNLLEGLYVNWKVLPLKGIADLFAVPEPYLWKCITLIRDRSEDRHGADGRFKILPRKVHVYQNVTILRGIEKLLDRHKDGSLPEMKEITEEV